VKKKHTVAIVTLTHYQYILCTSKKFNLAMNSTHITTREHKRTRIRCFHSWDN